METNYTVIDKEIPLGYIHDPVVGLIFRHYKKGTLYMFLDIQQDANNKEKGKFLRVSYVSLYDGILYNKPFHEFNEEVEADKKNPFDQKYKYTLVKLI